MSRFLICYSFLVTLIFQAVAQPDGERRYRNGVRLVQQGDYVKARAELAPLTDPRAGGVAPYAHYYLALADFKQQHYAESRLMLQQLFERFPDWNKMDDGYYLMAAALLESGQYEEGFSYLSRITSPELKADVARQEVFFISRINDLTRLKALQKQYPNNRNLALAVIDLIQRTSTVPADLELSDRLTNRFGDPAAIRAPKPTTAEPTPTTPARPERNREKGYYNVAVLFPFRVNDLTRDEPVRSNQYALDLYNGMKLAKAKLQSEGITVNLFAYDVDNDQEKTITLLNNPGFLQNDLVFGPLYAEPNRLTTAFAAQNGIGIVNPISTSSELVANQPLAFLANASLTQQALKTAAFARTVSLGRKAAIYYGNARKDSTLAVLYRAELKRTGYQIIDFQKITTDAERIRLSEANKPGHIFLVSSSGKTGPLLLKVLSQRKISVPSILTSTAFDFDKNPLSTFTRSDLYILYPDFMDLQRPEVDEFEEQYLAQRNIIPSTFAYQGYDMLLFFGRTLAHNNGQLADRSQMKTTPEEGYLLSGFDYTTSNDNQVVPIVRFDGTRFIIANQ